MTTQLMPETLAPATPRTLRRSWPILFALTLATLVVTIDNSVLNVALPAISRELHAGTGELQWIANAYSLLFGGLLLTGGNLADRLGRKRVLLGGLVAFGGASALVLLVHNGVELIALRALIGAAAAFVMPSTLALIYRLFDGPARATAMALWGVIGAIGFVGGPMLGGLLLDHFSWHAVFLVNVPVAAVALLVTAVTVPESADRTTARADLLGTALSVVTMTAIVYALVTGPVSGWTSGRVLLAGVCCVAALGAFVSWELRAEHPMVPIAMLRRVAFAGPAIAEAALMFAALGSVFLLTQQLQFADGYSPLEAGLRTAPVAIGALASGFPGLRLSRRFGANVGALAGYLLGALGLVTLAIGVRNGYWVLALVMFLFGAAMRMSITPVAVAVIDALPKERAGMGSALNDTFQEVGAAFGVALLGSAFNVVYRSSLPSGAPSAVRDSIASAAGAHDGTLVTAAHHAFESGMQVALVVAAVVMALVAVVAFKTVRADLDVSES
jgi:EmrB/QacA subfamily drug resistance transporter